MLGTVSVWPRAVRIRAHLRRPAQLRHAQWEFALHRLLDDALLEADLGEVLAFPVQQPLAKAQ
eukprot:172227-Alexandrium_andersonii.AAC.1